MLVPIDSVAGDWKKNLPPEIDKIMHADGHYVAAPFSVHRVNWLYINKAALDKAGGKVPTTWPEFFAVADKMKAAGIMPVAAGGQPWQDLTLWEDVVLSQGADFYKKAMVDLDQKTLTSQQMVEVFDTVRKIQGYFDNGRTGRDWNLATAMVINGKAGMQFMGDWAKGEFASANKKAGTDYICAAVPGTEKAYTFNVDSFVFFQQKGQKAATPGQLALAKTIMSPEFQEQFSLYKGSIPVRLGVSMAKFDDCAKKSYADEQVAIKSGGYVPSLAHGMAQARCSSWRDHRRRHEVHELARRIRRARLRRSRRQRRRSEKRSSAPDGHTWAPCAFLHRWHPLRQRRKIVAPCFWRHTCRSACSSVREAPTAQFPGVE